MKLLARVALLGAVALSQSAWADSGPYYVSYPGYCNVKRIYINSFGDLYGTEINCDQGFGAPLIGAFTIDGKVVVSTAVNGAPCLAVYGTDGSLGGGCSSGGPITYPPRSTFVVSQSASTAQPQPQFVVSTELPDLEGIKNLPPRP